ncbi:hypothetical protein HHL19_19885 [Streptomyces sp. R302]|uniref:hypothetical protein n=1 Tax=unclassified Streptomyces TaxID=2593676 RepID=UPI00145F1648|nr:MULTISPECIES: hypothetical protein [unclassified Streptomyces]NML50771.1 hypothetical protein [Streptomyces sp. R301]NML80866.1 hypothetical protein [Streptomyces sp. R302]
MTERKKAVSQEELDKITVPVTAPEGFTWPWGADHRPVWLTVPGSPVSGLEVHSDGTVRVNPAVPYPPHLADEWLNKFNAETGNYATYLVMGSEDHRYDRWMLVYAAMTSTGLDVIRASGLTVVREDPTRHDHWTNLLGLTTPKEPGPEALPDPDYANSCEGHVHSDWYKNSLDGGKRLAGVECHLPDGERVKKSSGGVRKVTHKPSSGETQTYR